MPTLFSSYRQYGQMTPAEKAYMRRNPHHAIVLREAYTLAVNETRRRFGTKGGWNDGADAFRHCVWSAVLSRELGYADALRFTTAHESGRFNPAAERLMDLHNNSIGIALGQSKGSDQSLSSRCYAAFKAGRLKISVR